MASGDDYYPQTPAEALLEVRDRQIAAATRLNSVATFAGWFFGLLLLAQAIGGLVLIFRTNGGRVCLPGRPHDCVKTATTYPHLALGFGLLAGSVAGLLLLLLLIFGVKLYAVSQEAAAYRD